MGQIWIREFTGGLDTRRLPETSPGGTLTKAVNCHINNGGEIEQRAVFEHLWTSPPNASVGLASDNIDLVVFGHAAGAPAGLPVGWAYQQLAHPDGRALLGVMDWDLAQDDLCVVGIFDHDGTQDRWVFVDGTRITDVNSPPTLSGSGEPISVKIYNDKLHIGSGRNVFFSAIRAATDFTATGAGFIDLSWQSARARNVYAIEEHDQFLALFSLDTIQLWTMDVDPAQSDKDSVLTEIGTRSPRSVIPFHGDTLCLHRTGVRSVRLREGYRGSDRADIGTAIDALVAPLFATGTVKQKDLCSAVVEPKTGNLWMAVLDKIFVYSYHPERRIAAWTVYEPGFVVDYMVIHDDRVYLRSGDDFYVYGGEGEYAYSEDVVAEAWLPYLDAEKPAQAKRVKGVDAAVRGTWEIHAGLDPRDEDAQDKIATITETTYGHESIDHRVESTHISLRVVSKAPLSATEPAIFSSATIHHDLDDDEDN